MRLEFAVTPRSSGETSKLRSSFFSDSSRPRADGVYLLDTVNLKRYPVLMRGEDKDRCICSSDLRQFELDRPTVLFADFPVAPENVKQISVAIPSLGLLPSVKIT
jgi:hypothetical protein